MSAGLLGRQHSHQSASTNPDVAAKISSWWTTERREQKRLQMLPRNPQSRYHGLSALAARQIRQAAGKCNRCASTMRLHVHHRDRNKRNQDPLNLEVLCKGCHTDEHRGEPRLSRTL